MNENDVFVFPEGAKRIGEMTREELLRVMDWAVNNAEWWRKEAAMRLATSRLEEM